MNIKLVDEDDSVLRLVAEPWYFDEEGSPEELVKDMSKLMMLSGGIGLAAPQCGLSKRIFVMGNQDHLVACINPVVISTNSILERGQEGCLSFPDMWLYVERPTDIVVEYYNISGEKVEQQLSGIMARVFLHELDHLDGICFDTKVSNFVLSRAKEKRKKVKRIK